MTAMTGSNALAQSPGIGTGSGRDRRDEALAYMPQLDALRAFAVLAVLVSHYCHFDSALAQTPHLGRWGVQLFFVLSGFLITGILMRIRTSIESGDLTFKTGLWHFYGRRYLRLAPIYYLTLIAVLFINPNLREYFWWYATYLQNFLFLKVGSTNMTPAPELNHFWTLAVEEQFYLVWPFLIIFTPRRWLVKAIVAAVCCVIPFKLVMFAMGQDISIKVLMPAQVELLGMGSLLAALYYGSVDGPAKAARLVRWIFWPGLALFVIYAVARYLELVYGEAFPFGNRPALLVTGPASALLFTCLIYRAARGFTGITGAVLRLPLLLYIGKISYGIYVYHYIVEFAFDQHLFPALGVPSPESNIHRFALYTSSTILVSIASWHAIEFPLSRLKKYLRYEESESGYPAAAKA